MDDDCEHFFFRQLSPGRANGPKGEPGLRTMSTSARLPGWKRDEFWRPRMASSCIAYCIFHIISIPLNCSDTALRVAKAIIGAKVIIFVFRHVGFVSRISCQKSSPGSLAFGSSRKPGWNFSYEPKGKLVPVTGLMRRSSNILLTLTPWLYSVSLVSRITPTQFIEGLRIVGPHYWLNRLFQIFRYHDHNFVTARVGFRDRYVLSSRHPLQ